MAIISISSEAVSPGAAVVIDNSGERVDGTCAMVLSQPGPWDLSGADAWGLIASTDNGTDRYLVSTGHLQYPEHVDAVALHKALYNSGSVTDRTFARVVGEQISFVRQLRGVTRTIRVLPDKESAGDLAALLGLDSDLHAGTSEQIDRVDLPAPAEPEKTCLVGLANRSGFEVLCLERRLKPGHACLVLWDGAEWMPIQ